MNSKTYVVTGANSGLGWGSALLLAQMGANVVMLCRNRQRGEAALAEIRRRSGNPNVELILADLTSQASIRRFVEIFNSRYNKLHGLLNCAGIATFHRRVTSDGLEVKFATEYLGHFLLTNLLVDALKAGAPSRVVTVSGEDHRGVTIDFDDLQGERSWNVVRHHPVSGVNPHQPRPSYALVRQALCSHQVRPCPPPDAGGRSEPHRLAGHGAGTGRGDRQIFRPAAGGEIVAGIL